MKKFLKSFLTGLSSIGFLRQLIPFLDNWHRAFVLGDKSRLEAVGSVYSGLVRTVFIWRWAPRKYAGGAIANLLGVQFLRYFFYNLRYIVRTGKGVLATECRRSGIALAPKLLDKSIVDEILDFYRTHQADASNHFDDFTELLICNTKGPAKLSSEYEELIHRLLVTCGIADHGKDLTGLDLRLYPFISVLHYKSFVDRVGQRDGQDIPHTDAFYPSFKLFVYLNDVDENNGAFRYLKGSHRFALNLALNAYKGALEYYFKGGKRQLYPTNATSRLTQGTYEWFSALGKPGDGVFFNVQGIHRRGNFTKDIYRERLVLLVDFRQVEVPFQRFAANC